MIGIYLDLAAASASLAALVSLLATLRDALLFVAISFANSTKAGMAREIDSGLIKFLGNSPTSLLKRNLASSRAASFAARVELASAVLPSAS